MENYFAVNCGLSIYLPAFLFVSIGYKFILHIIALVFALLSRKVKIEVLNDSRETAAIIYASTILLIITCLVIFALGETVNLLNIMWTLIIFSVSMIHLGLTFIPEVSAFPTLTKLPACVLCIYISLYIDGCFVQRSSW